MLNATKENFLQHRLARNMIGGFEKAARCIRPASDMNMAPRKAEQMVRLKLRTNTPRDLKQRALSGRSLVSRLPDS